MKLLEKNIREMIYVSPAEEKIDKNASQSELIKCAIFTLKQLRTLGLRNYIGQSELIKCAMLTFK